MKILCASHCEPIDFLEWELVWEKTLLKMTIQTRPASAAIFSHVICCKKRASIRIKHRKTATVSYWESACAVAARRHRWWRLFVMPGRDASQKNNFHQTNDHGPCYLRRPPAMSSRRLPSHPISVDFLLLLFFSTHAFLLSFSHNRVLFLSRCLAQSVFSSLSVYLLMLLSYCAANFVFLLSLCWYYYFLYSFYLLSILSIAMYQSLKGAIFFVVLAGMVSCLIINDCINA